ncbi:transmembrane prolyl 4-hydroxylase-like [Crassostrea virginica]|uniref:Transmembrane prolyl 4-hydroxylase-like n=1 Tax=Crassostrea virginica TaxID=6565 RepID=A0A8B8CC42_CRAVI|nr:transmembrane prolyl 4-hydroxylase-like [Crassostrea virginica]
MRTSSRCSVVLHLAALFTFSVSSTELCVTDNSGVRCGDGNHVRLTRLPGYEVGYVQKIDTNDTQGSVTLTTLNTKPLVIEAKDFLSPEECDYFVKMAKEEGLKESETVLNQPQNHRFVLRDHDGDRKLTVREMKHTIQGSFDVFLEDEDILKLYKETGWDKNGDELITNDELKAFTPVMLQKAIQKIVKTSPEKHSRMSKQVWLFPDRSKDKIFADVQKRVAKVVGLPIELIKLSDFQVVSYDIRGHYNAHWDSARVESSVPCCTREKTKQCRICRYMTILFYLNDVEEGGETAFPVAQNQTLDYQTMMEKELIDLYRKCEESPLKVAPSKGKAVIWYNHFVDENTGWLGSLDEFTFHGGCPVKKGIKWIANFWVKTTDHKMKDLKKMQKFYKESTKNKPKISKEEL